MTHFQILDKFGRYASILSERVLLQYVYSSIWWLIGLSLQRSCQALAVYTTTTMICFHRAETSRNERHRLLWTPLRNTSGKSRISRRPGLPGIVFLKMSPPSRPPSTATIAGRLFCSNQPRRRQHAKRKQNTNYETIPDRLNGATW